MRSLALCAVLLLGSALAADEPKPPMMTPPVKPNLDGIPTPDSPETKLVKFIKQKETEAKQARESAKKLQDEATELEKQFSTIFAEAAKTQKKNPPDNLPDEFYRIRKAYDEKLKEAQRAFAQAGQLQTDRQKAVKELEAKIGIVKLRELGIK